MLDKVYYFTNMTSQWICGFSEEDCFDFFRKWAENVFGFHRGWIVFIEKKSSFYQWMFLLSDWKQHFMNYFTKWKENKVQARWNWQLLSESFSEI